MLLCYVKKLTEKCTEYKQEITLLRGYIDKKCESIETLKVKVSELEEKLDSHEQYSRRNSIRISNMCESEHENLAAKVCDLFDKLECNIEASDIDRIHRSGPVQQGKTRQVLVKFATYQARQRVLKSKAKLRQLAEDEAEEDEEPRILFFNEDLTKRRATTLWKLRGLKKQKKVQDCWSFDGTVLYKDVHGKVTVASQLVVDTLMEK